MMDKISQYNHAWAALIVQELTRCGIEWFVVTPGSRSTPLAWAVASDERANSVIHYDERGASFHALGIAKARQEPVVFICTSGTAVANAFPAVVEASMAHVPLILLTADRPPELQETGANQTIDQVKIFGGYPRWYHGFPCPDDVTPPEYVLTTIDHAVHRALGIPPGPVHVNCPYREPLEPPVLDATEPDVSTGVRDWKASGRTYTTYAAEEPFGQLSETDLEPLFNAKSGLLVVGQLNSEQDVQDAAAIGSLLGWPVHADVASGLRLHRTADGGGSVADTPVIHYSDRIIASGPNLLGEPFDAVLQIGGAVTSKPLARLLAEIKPATHLRVNAHPWRADPQHLPCQHVSATLSGFLEFLSIVDETNRTKPKSEHRSQTDRLAEVSATVDRIIDDDMDSSESLSEIAAVRLVTKLAPPDTVLFLGNSLPIRWADMYGAPTENRLFIAANRGASGIDGNIATAAGYARAWERPVTAVIGDLATLHDVNSLALLRDLPAPVVIVVLNNDGGGIFHMLPIAEHTKHFEKYFATPHGLDFESFAKGFGIQYRRPNTSGEFEDAYVNCFTTADPHIIEVRTDRRESAELHARLTKRIAEAVTERHRNGP